MDAAARVLRTSRGRHLGIPEKDIGIFFITPCSAKATAIKQPEATKVSKVSGGIAISDVYRTRGSQRHPLRVCLDHMSGNAVENCCSCDKCLRATVALLAHSERPDAWGFRIPEPLHETVRKRLMSVRIPSYNLHHWDRLKGVTASALDEVDGETRELLSWVSTWNFDENRGGRSSRALPRRRRMFQRTFARLFRT